MIIWTLTRKTPLIQSADSRRGCLAAAVDMITQGWPVAERTGVALLGAPQPAVLIPRDFGCFEGPSPPPHSDRVPLYHTMVGVYSVDIYHYSKMSGSSLIQIIYRKGQFQSQSITMFYNMGTQRNYSISLLGRKKLTERGFSFLVRKLKILML